MILNFLFLSFASCSKHEDCNCKEPDLPIVIDPTKYSVDLFTDLSDFGRLKAFQITIGGAGTNFGAGLFVTSGPTGDDRSDRFIKINQDGKMQVISNHLKSNETIVFAKGEYGNGILITEPRTNRILRLTSAQDTAQVFSTVGTPPFGPATLFYGPNDKLFVTDFSGRSMLQLDSNGTSKTLFQLPSITLDPNQVLGAKGGFGGGGFGGGGAGRDFFISTFTIGLPGEVFIYADDYTLINRFPLALDGVNLIGQGPIDWFGTDVYVPSTGGGNNGDGGVYILSADGVLRPFLLGIDAVSVAFDTTGIMGGGMFVADINDGGGAGRIWRIKKIP